MSILSQEIHKVSLNPANQDLFYRNCKKSFIFSGSAYKYSGLRFSKVRDVANPGEVQTDGHTPSLDPLPLKPPPQNRTLIFHCTPRWPRRVRPRCLFGLRFSIMCCGTCFQVHNQDNHLLCFLFLWDHSLVLHSNL